MSRPDQPSTPTPALPAPSAGPRLGVLAFGDSITNGGGELQWGVALQSWALWTARGLGVPYTGYATDGAVVADVLAHQIPAFTARSAHPDGRYDVGCLYIGVNDVRGFDWDAEAFSADHAAALAFLRPRCDRLLCVTAPLDLGLPPAGPKVAELNAVISAGAAAERALVLDLADFGDRGTVMADRVHPTALGQVAIARRALAVLDADGLSTRADPQAMVAYQVTVPGQIRGTVTYGYRHLKLRAAEAWKGLRRPGAGRPPR